MIIKSFKNKMNFYIGFIILIFSLVIIIYNSLFYYDKLLKFSNETNLNYIKNSAITYSEWIDKHLRELEIFSKTNYVINYKKNEYSQRTALNNILELTAGTSEKSFDYYYISNTSGYYLASNLLGKRSIVERSYFNRVILGQNTVSNIIKSQINKRNVIVFSVPIYKEGQIIGTLSGVKYASSLDEIMKNFLKNEDIKTYIIDENGNILSSNDIENYNSAFRLKNIYTLVPDTKEFLGFDNIAYLNMHNVNDRNYFFYDIPKTMNWRVVSYFELSEIRKKVINNILMELVFLFFIMTVGMVLININSKLIVNYVEEISNKINQVSKGNYSIHMKESSITELGKLSKNFNDMVEIIEEEIYKDNLTEKYNYNYFTKELKRVIDKKQNFAILLLVLDNIKLLNDTFGFETCNVFIKEISDVIYECTKGEYTISRLAGDEFGLIVVHEDPELMSYKIFKKINNKLSDGVKYSGGNVSLSLSAGVAIYNDSSNYLEILNNAYIALNKSKMKHNSSINIYTEKLKYHIYEIAELSLLLKDALKNNEFFVNYQPIYSYRENKITGFEALIEWNSKEKGLVEPNNFIPILKNNGMILEVGKLLIENAINDIKKLNKELNSDFYLHVNLTYVELLNSEYIKKIEKIIEESGFDFKKIVFEISEKVMYDKSGEIKVSLNRIKRWGSKFALDNFGTFHTSIYNFNNKIVDFIKIDSSIIENEKENSLIIESMLDVAKKFNITSIALGVERKCQFDFLVDRGCDLLEGHYIFKATNYEGVLKKIKEFY